MKKLLLIAMLTAVVAPAFADDDIIDEPFWTPIEINLVSPIGLPWADRDVYGLRCNLLYGHSLAVYGIDFGLVGANRGTFFGLQANGFNYTDGAFRGVQFSPIGNFCTKGSCGLQLAGLVNWGLEDGCGVEAAFVNAVIDYAGLQFGAVNWNNGQLAGADIGLVNFVQNDITGASIGFSNWCNGSLSGCQIGVFNMAFGHSDGIQIGVFNASEDHNGAQIGLMNFNANGVMQLLPIVNVNFR